MVIKVWLGAEVRLLQKSIPDSRCGVRFSVNHHPATTARSKQKKLLLLWRLCIASPSAVQDDCHCLGDAGRLVIAGHCCSLYTLHKSHAGPKPSNFILVQYFRGNLDYPC